MNEHGLTPIVTAPEGISAERQFPIHIRLLGELPENSRETASLSAVLCVFDANVAFDTVSAAIDIRFQDGEGMAMARLTMPAESIKVRAYFFCSARFSGMLDTTISSPASGHACAPAPSPDPHQHEGTTA